MIESAGTERCEALHGASAPGAPARPPLTLVQDGVRGLVARQRLLGQVLVALGQALDLGEAGVEGHGGVAGVLRHVQVGGAAQLLLDHQRLLQELREGEKRGERGKKGEGGGGLATSLAIPVASVSPWWPPGTPSGLRATPVSSAPPQWPPCPPGGLRGSLVASSLASPSRWPLCPPRWPPRTHGGLHVPPWGLCLLCPVPVQPSLPSCMAHV